MSSFEPDSENAEYVEALYQQYLCDPDSLQLEWRYFFKGFEFGFLRTEEQAPDAEMMKAPPGEERRYRQRTDKGVQALVQAYRQLGHFLAKLDPLGHNRESLPLLELSEFEIEAEDLEKGVGSGGFLGETDGSLKGLLAKLKETYCRSIGVEYMDIPDKEQRAWLQERIEPCFNRPVLSEEKTRQVLGRLMAAEEFEQFLHTRYIGQKRFSLEGGESLVPLLDELVSTGSELGVEEVVIGMAHRGRLNVLAHLLHKPYENILAEFEGELQACIDMGAGDDSVGIMVTGSNGTPSYASLDITKLDGGAGTDTLSFGNMGSQGSTELTLTHGGVTNFENIDGTGGADIIRGDNGTNILRGSGGADTIYGGSGNDTLSGSTSWSSSNDSASQRQQAANDSGDNTNDNLYGQAGDDVLIGTIGDNILDGGTGADTLVFSSGANLVTSSVSGGTDGDSLVFSAVVKSATSIAGGGGNDTMVFNSSISGGAVMGGGDADSIQFNTITLGGGATVAGGAAVLLFSPSNRFRRIWPKQIVRIAHHNRCTIFSQSTRRCGGHCGGI